MDNNPFEHAAISSITFPNERHSNKTVSIFILKAIYFIKTSEMSEMENDNKKKCDQGKQI